MSLLRLSCAEAMHRWQKAHPARVAGETVIKFGLGIGQSERWEMVIRNGRVTMRWTAEDPEEYDVVALDVGYLAQPWFLCPERGWLVRHTTRMALLFHDLAMVMLPWWETHVHENFSRATRKAWSHHGATAQGDLGNRVYYLVVRLCMQMRVALGAPCLHTIVRMNVEHTGDVLEGIMGLQALGSNWDPTGIVSEVSIAVHNAWNSPNLEHVWDMGRLTNTIYTTMGLDSIKDEIRYNIHVAKVTARTTIALTIGRVCGFKAASLVYSFHGC